MQILGVYNIKGEHSATTHGVKALCFSAPAVLLLSTFQSPPLYKATSFGHSIPIAVLFRSVSVVPLSAVRSRPSRNP